MTMAEGHLEPNGRLIHIGEADVGGGVSMVIPFNRKSTKFFH